MAGAKSKSERLFQEFLSTAKVFIVDNSVASRSRLTKSLIDLGSKTNLITTFASYDQAENALINENPNIVLTDYDLGKKSGFDLLQVHREKYQEESKNSLYILITADSSQSLVARAAEEDVDSFLLKPYTINKLKELLISTYVTKMFPSEYIRTIEMGKELLFSGKPQESMALFERAESMHPQPTLACFYAGQASAMTMALDTAESSFKEGLKHNKIHYKCLVSLHELLFQLEKYEEAYDVVRTLADYFPANPKRMASVLHLAVKTQNYHDIEEYYNKFIELEVREEELTTTICAALTICGRYYLQKEETERALALFDKVGISASGRVRFLRIVLEYLTYYDQIEHGTGFLKKFPTEEKSSVDFKIASFLLDQEGLPAAKTIQIAQEFIKGKVFNPAIYFVLIKKLQQCGRDGESQRYLEEALAKWPGEISAFSRI